MLCKLVTKLRYYVLDSEWQDSVTRLKLLPEDRFASGWSHVRRFVAKFWYFCLEVERGLEFVAVRIDLCRIFKQRLLIDGCYYFLRNHKNKY